MILVILLTNTISSTDNNFVLRQTRGCIEKPHQIKLKGLPNFYKISGTYFRGAQPDRKGMKQLEKIGIKTVINLRAFHTDRFILRGTDLNYIHIPMKTWHPEKEDVIRFLRAVTKKGNQPVFVHCQHGADRTGMLTAIYRIVICGWTKKRAIKEMTQGGFGYHKIWRNLVRFIEQLDIREIKSKSGLK